MVAIGYLVRKKSLIFTSYKAILVHLLKKDKTTQISEENRQKLLPAL